MCVCVSVCAACVLCVRILFGCVADPPRSPNSNSARVCRPAEIDLSEDELFEDALLTASERINERGDSRGTLGVELLKKKHSALSVLSTGSTNSHARHSSQQSAHQPTQCRALQQ